MRASAACTPTNAEHNAQVLQGSLYLDYPKTNEAPFGTEFQRKIVPYLMNMQGGLTPNTMHQARHLCTKTALAPSSSARGLDWPYATIYTGSLLPHLR
jgi:hypothetical protein